MMRCSFLFYYISDYHHRNAMMSFSVFQTSSFATTYLFGCDLFKTFSFLSKEQELKEKKRIKKTTSSILPFMSYFKKAYEKLEKLRIKECTN